MLTVNTHIIEKGSLREKLKNILNYILEPYKTEPMKKLQNKMDELKDNSFIPFCTLVYPPHEEQQTYIDPDHTPDVYSYKTDDKWPHTIYEFLGTITSTTNAKGVEYKEKKKCVLVDGNIYYIYPAVIKNEDGLYDETSCKHVIYIPEYGFKIIDGQVDLYSIKTDGKFKHSQSIVYDEEKYRKYNRYRKIYNTYNWIGHKIYKVFHTIDSTVLCLRFPFLYPRNRFTNRHYTNWELINYCRDLKAKANRHYNVRIPYKADDIAVFDKLPEVADKVCEKNQNERCYYCIYNGAEYILNDKSLGLIQPVIIDGEQYIYDKNDEVWRNLKDGKESFSFEHEDRGYKSVCYDFVLNKNTNRWIKVVEFVHKYVLGTIFCIPTYNELDGMEEGWKRNFGIKMCKELRKQLIKDKQLFSFRIMQIKEKWGELCFYVASASKETYDIISKYENMSGRICIRCGKPAKYITSGWITPYCGDCYKPDDTSNLTVLDENGNVVQRPYDEDESEIDEISDVSVDASTEAI